MRKLLTACVLTVLILAISGTVQASLSWSQMDFTNIIDGGVTYDENGGNVVVDGTAFFDKVQEYGNPVSFQKIGGDGINNPVTGNFAMFGIFDYTDTDGVLAWAISNPTTDVALEIRAWGVSLDLDRDGDGDYSEHFTLNATDIPGVDYLTANFYELSQHGCTEVAAIGDVFSIWIDMALDAENSQVALSVVIDGFTTDNWGSIDAYLMAGELIGPYPESGYWTPGSGIRVAAIPEPATIALLGLGGLLLRKRK